MMSIYSLFKLLLFEICKLNMNLWPFWTSSLTECDFSAKMRTKLVFYCKTKKIIKFKLLILFNGILKIMTKSKLDTRVHLHRMQL